MEQQKINPVVWFEIYANDMERATQFYEKVLNVKLEDLPNPTEENFRMRAFPGNEMLAGSNGAIVWMEGVEAGNNSTVIYFGTEDCSIEQGRIEIAGGRVFKSKMSIGEYGFITLAFDTEGNMFGLHSMK